MRKYYLPLKPVFSFPKKTIIVYLFVCIFYFWNVVLLNAQDSITDSLKIEIEKTVSVPQKLDLLLQLSKSLRQIDLSESLVVAKRGEVMAQENNSAEMIADFELEKGIIYSNLSKYDSAYLNFDKAILFYQKTGQQGKQGKALDRKAAAAQANGAFGKAGQFYFQALALFEEVEDMSSVAGVYVGLSDVFYYQERVEEGAEYGEQAIEIYESLNDEEGVALANQFTADNYLVMGNYEQALGMLNKALTIRRKLNSDPLSIASLVNSRGNVLKHLKRYDEAIVDYQESLAIAEKLNHPGGISACIGNIGDVYMKIGDYKKALPLKIKSAQLQEENGFLQNLMEAYDHLSIIYKNLNNYENALLFREKYVTAKDSILTTEKDQTTSDLRTKYETAQKETLIAAQEQQLSQQRIIQGFALGFVTLLGVILFLLYRSFQQKQKSNLQLETTNQQLGQKNKENELLLKEIHHRVKNNLQTISSLLSLQSASIQDSNVLSAVEQSQSRVQSMALIHQKLYQGKNLAAVEMKDFFQTLGETIVDSYGIDTEQIEMEYPMEKIELDVDNAIPLGLIANELLTNTFKYAFPNNRKGKIKMSLEKLGEKEYRFFVKDNGVGMSKNPTSNNENTGVKKIGFGTQLIQLLVQQLEGVLQTNHTEGMFTEIKFKLN